MTDDNTRSDGETQDSFAVEGPDPRCPVVSWVMPTLALPLLYIGLRYPIMAVFNLAVIAFGFVAMVRALVHMRKSGTGGLGWHVAVGILLNMVIITLVIIYMFIGIDPLHIRP